MTRLNTYEVKLKAAKAELKIRTRVYNAARRGYYNSLKKITTLEEKIGALKLAKTQQRP